MLSITPCRTQISDRFPVASFVVRVPAEQSFEVACATHPDLFRPDMLSERTEHNFFTTRFGGLLRAPAGEATIILPPEQLKNFAGSNRIYYALGAYSGADSRQGRFTIRPDSLDQTPYVQLAQDFTGRNLGRLGSAPARAPSADYGGRGEVLTWGGDLFAAAAADNSHDTRVHSGDPQRNDNSNDNSFGSERWRQLSDYRQPRGTAAASVASNASNARFDTQHGDQLPPPSSRWGSDPAAYESDEYDSDAYESDEYRSSSGFDSERRPPEYDSGYSGGEPDGAEDVRGLYGYASSSSAERSGVVTSGDEPEGAEDARALTGHGDAHAPYGGLAEPDGNEEPGAESRSAQGGAQDFFTGPGGHEPPGYEDISELLTSGLQLESLRPGTGDATSGDHESYGSPATYADSYGSTHRSVTGAPPPASARAPSGILLGPREMTRIVRPVFKLEGGMDAYGKVDSDGRGLVWGMVGFNQRDGSLREVLHAARRRDQQWYPGESVFEKVFGAQGSRDILYYMDRTEPAQWMDQVGGMQLVETSWAERFRKAGACHRPEVSGLALEPERDPFKVAQNEIAITRHLVPALPVARELGFNTDRSLAMLYDRIVDMGRDDAVRWISESLSAISPTTPVKDKLSHLVATAERQARPWSHRLRAVHDNTADLYDTIYRLDEV